MNRNQINSEIQTATGINRKDFDSDLNAMHEAEKLLFPVDVSQLCEPDHWKAYREILQHVCVGQAGGVLRATAAQRAEAFLRTIGKWKDV